MNQFIEEFNSLKKRFENGEIEERELFKVAGIFNKATGGKVSHYNSPLAVGVAVVPVVKDRAEGFLGCKRGIMPFLGGVAFPGGFVNENESVLEASIRELQEETSLVLPNQNDWEFVGEKKTPHNQILMFYKYKQKLDWKIIENAFLENDKKETQDIVFVTRETEMCFSLHAEIRDEQFKVGKPKSFPYI